MAMVALTGAATLLIAIGVDLPDLHKTGEIGHAYAQASAGPGGGYYYETLAGVLLLLAGGGMLLLAANRSGRSAVKRAEPRRPAAPEPEPEPEPWL
jgi:hypothetical protein